VATDSPGLGIDTGTYSATQGATHAEGLVTVEVRADLIIRALMSGGAAEGTALTLLSNTLASTNGLLITDADIGTADLVGGSIWCISGANVGQSRKITAWSSAVSATVTVAFLNDIAVGDEFLFTPVNVGGDGTDTTDGGGNIQFTTLFTQMDGAITTGTGASEVVYWLELNGQRDSYVQFLNGDHLFSGVQTV
ncbi:MAG: hypothetical protein Q8S13_00955, partial [Dehalococcoidia bacterium]|nr:hypothetical protein [Dehalococcoidia bacterium]